MSKEFINLKYAFNNLARLETELNANKDKKTHTKVTEQFKQNFDKLYFYAFYDYRFKIANETKLLDDLKTIDKSLKPRFIFINVKKMIDKYYQGEEDAIFDYINLVKTIIKKYSLVFKDIYIVNNFLVIVTNSKNVEKLYYELKDRKDNFNFGICYVKYKTPSIKTNKNFKLCVNQAYKILNGEIKDFEKNENLDD